MLIAIVILLFAGVIAFDYRPKLKGQPKKNKAVYMAALIVSFSILILYSMNINVPGPTLFIKGLVRSIFKAG